MKLALAAVTLGVTAALTTTTPANAAVYTTSPSPSHPQCVTYLPNADGHRPSEKCFASQGDFLAEVHTGHRLGTEFQDIDWNQTSPATHYRLAEITRRTMDYTGCRLTNHTGIREQYMPDGWSKGTNKDIISSFRLDEKGCLKAEHWSSYRFQGVMVPCGYMPALANPCYNFTNSGSEFNDETESVFFSGTPYPTIGPREVKHPGK